METLERLAWQLSVTLTRQQLLPAAAEAFLARVRRSLVALSSDDPTQPGGHVLEVYDSNGVGAPGAGTCSGKTRRGYAGKIRAGKLRDDQEAAPRRHARASALPDTPPLSPNSESESPGYVSPSYSPSLVSPTYDPEVSPAR